MRVWAPSKHTLADLPDRKSVQLLLDEAFPDMAGNYCGSTIPDAIFVERRAADILGHAAVFKRNVLLDGRPDRIGLLGGIAVATAWQGQGLAKALIAAAHDQLRRDGIAFAILFAFEPDRYLSSGYSPMTNQTRFLQAGRHRQFVYRGAMVAALGDEPWTCRLLDLQGPVA
nr:GNAT family N-acetyltransferase [uncultured Devosia sp.]